MAEQLIKQGKIAGDVLFLEILGHHFLADGITILFVGGQNPRQILPAAGSDKGRFLAVGADEIEGIGIEIQESQNAGVDPVFPGILFPDGKVGLYIDAADTVQCDDIKIAYGFVIFRWISGSYDQPALGDAMAAEGFILQQLQHDRRQRLGHTVNLVDKEDADGAAGGFHTVVDGGHDFAHGVFRHRVSSAAVGLLFQSGQPDGALAGMVGHGIGNQSYRFLPGDLSHDGGFADSGRADQQDGPLLGDGNGQDPVIIGGGVGLESPFDFCFCFLYVHWYSPYFRFRQSLTAQSGTGCERKRRSAKTKAVS